ncbi:MULTISPECIES: cell division protein FtsQ/DivIB [unclassified Neisseria]|uniref:cell division protein FtsQ/DivIB n=1 Tax=unclassified Neisseria TaxID=2623750 RepID=UPI0026671765|nr:MULTISPECIES: cell division protein FtsQ/DivIB [unclassified Neisseria]MDO1509765.1 cell division protein FtsQ/DivIB [Neisseria sp. MVDL19-042950]MDO1515911.1 cell division protein FtsQ/DivIB [Neisseria sp. MVDL18-041461]MDO1563024.1 cell division protein FtsQ/DivIB [Neisseria sp. MVDL20-010259]
MWDNAGALRRITRWLMLLVVLILLGAFSVWVYNSPYFPVKQVKIEGDVKRTGNKQLQTVAQKYIRGNILKADLNGAQRAFEQLPWVAKVSVRRRLPDTVEIDLVERIPVARWKESGLVDSNGNLFKAATDESFPLFEGQPGAAKVMVKHYNEFSAILKPLELEIAKLEYTPRSAWSVELNNGISVRLGREHEIKRLQRFAEIWPDILSSQQSNLMYVDMRYKDGFAVRYRKQQEEIDGPSESNVSETAEVQNQQ